MKAPQPKAYKVAPGKSVSHGGITYSEGQEILLPPEAAEFHKKHGSLEE